MLRSLHIGLLGGSRCGTFESIAATAASLHKHQKTATLYLPTILEKCIDQALVPKSGLKAAIASGFCAVARNASTLQQLHVDPSFAWQRVVKPECLDIFASEQHTRLHETNSSTHPNFQRLAAPPGRHVLSRGIASLSKTDIERRMEGIHEG
eukprot:1417163-Amphidinium_carterae.2